MYQKDVVTAVALRRQPISVMREVGGRCVYERAMIDTVGNKGTNGGLMGRSCRTSKKKGASNSSNNCF
jgi:hypothetical protein